MTYEIERKILNSLSLTDEEVNIFLKYICGLIRKNSNIDDPIDTNCKVCFETSEKFGRLMLLRFGCDVDLLDIKKMLEIPLTHYLNIISFNVNETKKTYLVDMTYSQFFNDNITLDGNDTSSGDVVSTEDTFKKIENNIFVKKLREEGFVELNTNILKQYIDAFLDICKVQNKEIAYKNIEKLLSRNKINISIKK